LRHRPHFQIRLQSRDVNLLHPLPSRSEAARLQGTEEEEGEGEEGRGEEQLVQQHLNSHVLGALETLHVAFEESIPVMTDGASDQTTKQEESERAFAIASSPPTTRRGQNIAQSGDECTGHGFGGQGASDEAVVVGAQEAFEVALYGEGKEGGRERGQGRGRQECVGEEGWGEWEE